MKSYPNLKMLIMYLMITFNILLSLPNTVIAQRDKDEEAIILELTINYSDKIEAALKKDLPRYNKMKSEAEEVAKIKDNAGKKKAMDNYANTHKQHYGTMVKNAEVDLNALLVKLEKKFPDYLFTITDGYSVVFEKKTQSDASSGNYGNSSNGISNDFVFASDAQPVLYPETALYRPASMVSTIIPLSFTKSKSIDCSLIAGATVEFGTSSIKSISTGVVAGGCVANGDLKNSTLLPGSGVTSIKLKLNFTLEVSGYAVGVLINSVTSSSATKSVYIDGQTSSILRERISKTAFAPVLWVASFSESKSFTYNPDLTTWKGKTLKISGYTFSFSMSAACCATSSWGKVNVTSASLTTTN
jgi:hypothetical protein